MYSFKEWVSDVLFLDYMASPVMAFVQAGQEIKKRP
jgi:hypothetical protein